MQKSPIFLVTRWKGKSVYKTWFPKILGKDCDWPPHSGHCLNRSVAFLEHRRKERFHSRGRHIVTKERI